MLTSIVMFQRHILTALSIVMKLSHDVKERLQQPSDFAPTGCNWTKEKAFVVTTNTMKDEAHWAPYMRPASENILCSRKSHRMWPVTSPRSRPAKAFRRQRTHSALCRRVSPPCSAATCMPTKSTHVHGISRRLLPTTLPINETSGSCALLHTVPLSTADCRHPRLHLRMLHAFFP